MRFVPTNYHTSWAVIFGVSFTVSFSIQENLSQPLKIGVIAGALLLIGIGIIMDMRMRRQQRALHF